MEIGTGGSGECQGESQITFCGLLTKRNGALTDIWMFNGTSMGIYLIKLRTAINFIAHGMSPGITGYFMGYHWTPKKSHIEPKLAGSCAKLVNTAQLPI